MRTSILKSLWLACALTGVIMLLDHDYAGGTSITVRNRVVAWLLVYAVGWIFLLIALARDPDCRVLESFVSTAPARLAAVGVLVALQCLAVVASTAELLLAAMMLATGLFALWATSPRAEVLARKVARILLLTTTLALTGIAGEAICRIPGIVNRTGGTTAAKERWWKDNLDFDRVTAKNVFSIRSFHVDAEKPPGTFRIVALGDSFTAGDYVPRTEDTWPYVLERILRDKNLPVEVINLGGGGSTTVTEARVLERIGWWFDPDLVILQYNLNDPLPSGENFRPLQGTLSFFRTLPLVPLLNRSLQRKSYLYAFLNGRFRRLQIRLLYPDGYAPLYRQDYAGWQATARALGDMAQQTRERHVPMLVALFPSFEKDLDESSYRYLALHKKIASAVREVGLPFVDLRHAFAETNPDGLYWHVLPWDSHPGVEAHRLAGQTIAEELERLAVVSPCNANGPGRHLPR